mmetsp:Transcript_26908/g.59075  ORF Transcript_26908/g.59075 Transcript_26908/m.59075 type:complete len:348 (+) Transcript_26908:103-1146(+)|eukprot:CAMPEP_0168170504 /NCGR_PEP_ID=MMETSP0139_2-20121125/4216_1 /TAXON_ID=44445 /ORGANISM="Pseudo-nitzschia australis, Strain 10249 10 AB" /LENGTH=347 /DNA_ID=CAMNT_0008088013 /DNA_START=49 /DNA_END=1092 /DNA_ORIENTATION=+
MSSSIRTTRLCIAVSALFWFSAFLGQCEATTVSLTAGPHSNSRRHAFLSREQSSTRAQLLPTMLDESLDGEHYKQVEDCSLTKNLVRGAFLRILSDLSGGTPLESIKCRVTISKDNMFQAYQNIVNEGSFWSLWSGTSSRTVEGALLGAFFILGSTAAKKQVVAMGGGKNLAALAGGTVGGVAQAIVMTPAGMIFTSLNVNQGKPGYENDNAMTVARRIVKEKGLRGLFYGGGPMCLRQASNWSSRSLFTEIARTNLKMSKFGILGEIGSGVIGGLGSCWNTPIETIRVNMHRDVSMGKDSQAFGHYWNEIKNEEGMPGLFRGVTPRGIQAIWQTVFMVVVPNVLGI